MKRIFLLVPVLVLAAGAFQPSVGADTGVKVIVNPQVKGTQITRTALAQLFLKQAPRWADGVAAQPVDQSIKSPVRSAFSSRVLGQPLIEVQIYWQKKMSQGVTPPPVRTTDEDVVAYVAETPGAIGYVSTTAAVPETVKTIEVAN